MGIRTAVKQILVRQQDKKYEAELAKRRVTYEQWAMEQEAARPMVPQVEATQEFVIVRQKKGRLAENAEEKICAFFGQHPEVEILYGDEDLWAVGAERTTPWFKPCWSPDTYRSQLYPGSVIAVRKTLLEKAGGNAEDLKETATALPIWKKFCSTGGGRMPWKEIHGKNIRQRENLTGCGKNLRSRQNIFPHSTKYR